MELPEFEAERRKVVRNGLAAAIFSVAILAAAYAALPHRFAFPSDRSGTLAYALQWDIGIFVWVAVAIRMVSRGRLRSADDIRGSAFSPPSPKIAVESAFLQNTLEQAFIAVGAHLALATLPPGPHLSLIPAAVLLFAIGRISFYLLYRNGAGGRAFGMVTTMVPTIVIYLYVVGSLAVGTM